MIPPEIIPLIWFAGIGILAYAIFHKFSDVIKERVKQTHTPISKNANIDSQFDSMVNNAPTLLNNVNKIIDEQKKDGVPETQMKGLLQKNTKPPARLAICVKADLGCKRLANRLTLPLLLRLLSC